ncbi:MAG: bifunctional diguanylate cyclase/phosphodiesterase, partial [Proteobacteria bacterium]|nr:bifunctional diguanylate cyclase/phosphodiesterase [Pseudomonadota bacterium]
MFARFGKAWHERRRAVGTRQTLHVVAPIVAIVGVAILCIVFAALTSARRADQVAREHEQHLFSRALTRLADRTLREVAAIITSDDIAHDLGEGRGSPDAHRKIEGWLKEHFNHDFAFVVAADDRITHGLLTHAGDKPESLVTSRLDLTPIVDYMRGRGGEGVGAVSMNALDRVGQDGRRRRAVLMQNVLGLPTFVAAAVVTPSRQTGGGGPPAMLVVSAKSIGGFELAEIGDRLEIKDLRQLAGPMGSETPLFTIDDRDGDALARFAWTPRRPGAEIFDRVMPYIAFALVGFAVMAALVLLHMRRAAARIALGERRMHHLAMHDPLCGLPNRTSFGERLELVIESMGRDGLTAAVFYIDLDHFKEVNDTLGHDVGDEIIREVTTRLSAAVRAEDLVARLGGDEFAVISVADCSPDNLLAIAARMIACVSTPYRINGQDIVIGASVGIATINNNTVTAADTKRHADLALYRAKNEGRNRAYIYDTDMDADLFQRKQLENELRKTIAAGDLQVAYQPLFSQSGQTMCGVEALARWTHPEHGIIPPDRFIPIAEHIGLIHELGEWVLRRACTDGQRWKNLTIAVNVSPVQFRRPDFADTVGRVLNETGIDPARVELEVTESTLLGKIDTTQVAMARLKALGVRLALDDFGTGYASLQYLRRFPFDRLKIDRSFIQNLDSAPGAAAIVNAVVGIGRGLGMAITAEGVETA